MKRLWGLILTACALSCCGAASDAMAQYRFDVLNTDSGLPQNSVHSILQSRDGYLWFTTFDGLVRYNGADYTVFNKANSKGILSNRFLLLYEDTDGTLWAGTEDGGLTRYKDGRFHTYTTADGLPHALVAGVRRTPAGDLLVTTAAGLARLRGERFEVVSTDANSFASDMGLQGSAGAVWYRVGTELRRVRDGVTTTYTVPAGGRGELLLNQLYEDHEGRLWIGTQHNPQGEVWALKDEVMTRYSAGDGLPVADIYVFYEDREGVMWFGTDGKGLVSFKDGRFTTYTTAEGLASNAILSIYEDREGTLWIGTQDNGVTRMSRRVITTLAEKDGLTGRVFYPILEDHAGGIWVGNVGVNRLQDGKVTYYPLNLSPQYSRRRAPAAQVSSLYEDRQGRLWIGASYGVYRFQNEQFIDDQSMTTTGEPYAIFEDSHGVFWFGYGQRLIRYENGQVKEFTIADGLLGFVQPIFEDSRGRIWIGSYGGLAQYVDGHLVILTEKDGLSSNRVRAIYEDSDGTLWIGTYDGGLNRFKDGKFTAYTTREGLFSNGVFAILEDRRGNFWMSSNQGIHRVSRQQLNAFAEGRLKKIDSVSYGKADGMLSVECNGARQPSAIKTRDGRLWFPTFDGVAIVDPEAVTSNSLPPPVVIEQVALDRQEIDVNQPIEISPGTADLEIHYAGLSFIKPESVQFKYKLEGLDKEWVEAGNRRVAYYTHLPAGEYVFRVIAANADGVWNETGAMIRVRVIPPFWQRLWFLALATFFLGLAVAIAIRARMQKLERARAAQESFARQLIVSQENERKRIAAELHDSLGQNLLVIKNWAAMARRFLEPQSRAREPLDEIAASVTASIAEVREIAYNLRPYHLDEIGLTAALHSMIERVADASGIGFTVEIDPLDGLLAPEAEINLYRVIQESLNNIVKHAEATAVEIAIHRDSQSLTIMIKDNGKGFLLEQIRKDKDHGFGLRGMSERVRLLGGRQTIQSAAGAGTIIHIAIDVQGESHVG